MSGNNDDHKSSSLLNVYYELDTVLSALPSCIHLFSQLLSAQYYSLYKGYGNEDNRYYPGFSGYKVFTSGEKANKLINNVSIGDEGYVENNRKDGLKSMSLSHLIFRANLRSTSEKT